MADFISYTGARFTQVDRQQFEKIFKTPLLPWLNPLTGFDIVGFDLTFLHSPADVSCSTYIREKFGVFAQELIGDFIHRPSVQEEQLSVGGKVFVRRSKGRCKERSNYE